MDKPLVSVIMPVYKVEEYVGRAIESILQQTYPHFEFFAVDDGTPDKSGEICDRYAAQDSRITVIHKENGGAPSARNVAIERARGKYFYFLDSDDWAEPTMLEDMVRLAEEHDAQYVVSGYYIDTYYNENEFVTQKNTYVDTVCENADAFRKVAVQLFDRNLLYTPWNKLYKASYIQENNLRFPQTFWDDFPFNMSVIRDVERVVITEKAYYHFIRARAESETAKYVAQMYDKREEEQGWMEELFTYWGLDTAESREFLARRYIERLLGCVENVTNAACALSKNEKKAAIRAMIKADRTRRYLKQMRPRSFKMRVMLIPLRLKWTWLTYCEGCIISRVKAKNTKLFATLKANR